MKAKYEREYRGVTITAQNYKGILDKEGREGINFHNKHLKAYLRGDTFFTYGYEKDENGKPYRDNWGLKIPRKHRVQSVLREIPADNL